MQRLACGGWGVQPSEFWRMSPEEWWRLYDYHTGGKIPERNAAIDQCKEIFLAAKKREANAKCLAE